MGDNNYAPLMGPIACPVICGTDYSNPASAIECPSACNYYDIYSNLSNMYDTYIPQASKSRIVDSGSLTTDYTVYNPKIVDFKGTVGAQGTDLNSAAVLAKTQTLSSLVGQINLQVAYAAQSQKTAADAALNVSKLVATLGMASANNEVSVASNAANDAASQLQGALSLQSQIVSLSNDISKLALVLPQPISSNVQNAISNSAGAPATASAAVASIKASSDAAQKSAAAANTAINKPQEAFRFLNRIQEHFGQGRGVLSSEHYAGRTTSGAEHYRGGVGNAVASAEHYRGGGNPVASAENFNRKVPQENFRRRILR